MSGGLLGPLLLCFASALVRLPGLLLARRAAVARQAAAAARLCCEQSLADAR